MACSAGIQGYAALTHSVCPVIDWCLVVRSAGIQGYAALTHSVRPVIDWCLMACSAECFRSLETEGRAERRIGFVNDYLICGMHVDRGIIISGSLGNSIYVIEVTVREKYRSDGESVAFYESEKYVPLGR